MLKWCPHSKLVRAVKLPSVLSEGFLRALPPQERVRLGRGAAGMITTQECTGAGAAYTVRPRG